MYVIRKTTRSPAFFKSISPFFYSQTYPTAGKGELPCLTCWPGSNALKIMKK